MKSKVILLSSVFLASMLVTFFTNTNDYLHTIAQLPAIASLLSLLALFLLDEMRYQKIIREKELEAISSLFAGSHYATSIYNKHIEFCESYWQRAIEIVKELTAKAAFPELVNRANALRTFRLERAIWLTEEMNLGLEGFEQALRDMGADSGYLDHLPVGEKRSEIVDGRCTTFRKVLMIGPEYDKKHDPISYIAVLKELQKILGISEAYEFRKKTLERIR